MKLLNNLIILLMLFITSCKENFCLNKSVFKEIEAPITQIIVLSTNDKLLVYQDDSEIIKNLFCNYLYDLDPYMAKFPAEFRVWIETEEKRYQIFIFDSVMKYEGRTYKMKESFHEFYEQTAWKRIKEEDF